MTHDQIIANLEQTFAGSIISISAPYQFLTIEVAKPDLKNIIEHLQKSELGFGFLTDLCGIHFPENKEKELGVIYHLHNLPENVRLRIKSFTTREDGTFETITDLFAGANWMERETFDFYGIRFNGHPDLRPILNMEDLGYHPMLKEYPLEDATRHDKNDAMFGR